MKIFCVGRNYVDHAKELNNPVPETPVIFMKPPTALLVNNKPFFYPEFSKDIHFEVELVIKICKNGRHVAEKFASSYYNEITVGIDLTARDVQKACKEKGLPWEIAKGFDRSAPLGKFIKKEKLQDPDDIQFSLKKNDETVQEGHSKDMVFSFEQLIAHISKYFTVQTGDLIFTGTPAGVGAVQLEDTLEAYLEGNKLLTCKIK